MIKIRNVLCFASEINVLMKVSKSSTERKKVKRDRGKERKRAIVREREIARETKIEKRKKTHLRKECE